MEEIWRTEWMAPRCPQNSAGGRVSHMSGNTTYRGIIWLPTRFLRSEESNSSRSRSASATIWSNSGCFIMLRWRWADDGVIGPRHFRIFDLRPVDILQGKA